MASQEEKVDTRITVRIKDVVKMSGISQPTIYRLLQNGELSSIKVGRSTLILMESFRAFIASRQAGKYTPKGLSASA